MALFASAAALAEYLGEAAFTGARLAQATSHLEIASARIQNWTRQRIERVAGDVIVLAGTADWELVLPERPVVSVGLVKVDGAVLAAGGYRIVGDTLVRRTGGWVGPTDSVVEVTYTHGYSPIPDDIRAVTLALAARMSSNPLGVTQEGIGSYSVSYGGGGVAFDGDEVFASLSRYRRRSYSAPLDRPARSIYPADA